MVFLKAEGVSARLFQEDTGALALMNKSCIKLNLPG